MSPPFYSLNSHIFWLPVLSLFYSTTLCWNDIDPCEFQQKHDVTWHFIAYLTAIPDTHIFFLTKSHIFPFSFLSSLAAKSGYMIHFWQIRLTWSPLVSCFKPLQGKGLFLPFSAVPTHPIFEYRRDTGVMAAILWVAQGSQPAREGWNVWFLTTPWGSWTNTNNCLPPEFWLCERCNSYSSKPQLVKFSNIYNPNIPNSYILVSGERSQFSFEGRYLANMSQYFLRRKWMYWNKSTGSCEFGCSFGPPHGVLISALCPWRPLAYRNLCGQYCILPSFQRSS